MPSWSRWSLARTSLTKTSPILVGATGGEVLSIESTRDLTDQFARVLTAFRTRYVLTYTLHGVEPGGYHRIDVHVNRSGAAIRARSGYFGDVRRP